MISITQPAAQWYIREMDLFEGDSIRFYVRYGGHSDIHRGFSLALSKGAANNPAFSTEVLGITFYVEESDAWYFADHHFHIKYKRKYDEVIYEFESKEKA
ncbi:HesB/YadR/YfhF family protein [Sediminibacillus albus]|uniref:Uncharacterized protein YneR n=1 Tax=Sediminibacillus albus TaxID=407036 RepID=A0A1G8ZZ00_9BACI|nr:HesB/YadR/YfhF family protein [Sediminibacillus albus]SDK20359.1 Uncharacterized protein YneR [Sediminibacillus albus]